MPNSPNSTADELATRMSLIHLAQTNQPEAWQVMVNLYTPLIRHWAWLKGVRCPHEQDNIKQEVLQRAWLKLHTFSKPDGRGSFRGWLRTITENYIYSNCLGTEQLQIIGGSDWHHRINQVPHPGPSLDVLLDSMSGEEVPPETGLIFRRIMDWVQQEYNATQFSSFFSTVIDQRPARDVAADLEINVNIVYQTKSRILARIRNVFADLV